MVEGAGPHMMSGLKGNWVPLYRLININITTISIVLADKINVRTLQFAQTV